MAAFRRDLNLPHFELHPIAALFVNDENLAGQIQESVKTRISFCPLSHPVITVS